MSICAKKISQPKAHKNMGKLKMVINKEYNGEDSQQALSQEALKPNLQEIKDKRCALRAEIFHAYSTKNKEKERQLSSIFDNLTQLINKLEADQPAVKKPTPNKTVQKEPKIKVKAPAHETSFIQNTTTYNVIANDLSNHPEVELSLVTSEYKPKTMQIITQHLENTKISLFMAKINTILSIFTHNGVTKREY